MGLHLRWRGQLPPCATFDNDEFIEPTFQITVEEGDTF